MVTFTFWFGFPGDPFFLSDPVCTAACGRKAVPAAFRFGMATLTIWFEFSGGRFSSYTRIPYALPPVGERQFLSTSGLVW
jgi:hypothetical protein